MGAIGRSTKSISGREDYFAGSLGERGSGSSIDRLTEVERDNLVNPNVAVSEDYRKNCALCTTAAALQMLGYDVEAMPRDKTWRGFNSVFDVDYDNPDNFILGAGIFSTPSFPHLDDHITDKDTGEVYDVPRMPRGADAAAKAIDNKVKSWGEGSFGAMSVIWKDGRSAHSVLIFNQDGKAYGYDAQHNKLIPDLAQYLKRTRANSTSIARLDNAKIKSNIKDLDKMVKKSSRKNRAG